MSMPFQKKIIFLLFLAFFLFASQTNALKEDFSIFFEKNTLDICACSVTGQTITVQNIGDVPSTYSLLMQGDAAPLMTIAEGSFTLEQGETKKLHVFMNTPCSDASTKTWIIRAKTSFGLEKQAQQTITTHSCPNAAITTNTAVQQSCPGGLLEYAITVKNTGAITETYGLSITKFAQYATLSETALLLAPGETKTVFLFINLPAQVFGTQPFEFQALTSQTKMLASIPLEARIDRCYDFTFSFEDQTLCNRETKIVPLTLTNLALVANGLTLQKIEGFTRKPSAYLLYPQEMIAVNLTIDAGILAPAVYNTTVSVAAERGGFAKQKDVSIRVENCHDIATEVFPAKMSIACQVNEYPLEIENKGTKKETVHIETDAKTAIGSPTSLTLSPGEKKTTSILHTIPCESEDKETITITVTTENQTLQKKSTITTKIISPVDAYKLWIGDATFKKMYYKNEQIRIPVEHTGKKATQYFITVQGPPWIEPAQQTIILSPEEKQNIQILTKPTNETAEGAYGFKLSLTVTNTKLSFERTFDVFLAKKTAAEKVADFFKAAWPYLLLLLLVLLLLLFLPPLLKTIREWNRERPLKIREVTETPLHLSIDKTWRKKKELSLLKLLGILLLLLVLLALLYLGSMYVTSNQQPKTGEELLQAPSRATITQDGLYKIPITVYNNATQHVTYTIALDKNVPWIFTDKNKMTVDAKKKETFNIFVNVSKERSDGDYIVRISLSVEADGSSTQKEIDVSLQRDRTKAYLTSIIAAILFLLILLLIVHLLRRKTRPKMQESMIKLGEEEKRSWKWLWITLIALITLTVLIFGLFALTEVKKERVIPAEKETIDFETKQNETGVGINLTQGQQLVLPVLLKNMFDERAIYIIKNTQEWVHVPKKTVNLETGETEQINITFFPTANVSDGYYEMSIQGIPKNQNITFTKTIGLTVTNKSFATRFGEFLQRFWGLITLLVVCVILIAIFIGFRKRETKKSIIIKEIKEEIGLHRKKSK